jgi:hypothetical protein
MYGAAQGLWIDGAHIKIYAEPDPVCPKYFGMSLANAIFFMTSQIAADQDFKGSAVRSFAAFHKFQVSEFIGGLALGFDSLAAAHARFKIILQTELSKSAVYPSKIHMPKIYLQTIPQKLIRLIRVAAVYFLEV